MLSWDNSKGTGAKSWSIIACSSGGTGADGVNGVCGVCECEFVSPGPWVCEWDIF